MNRFEPSDKYSAFNNEERTKEGSIEYKHVSDDSTSSRWKRKRKNDKERSFRHVTM